MFVGDKVSIHAPWEGCDSTCSRCTSLAMMFQFTHPGKGATQTRGHERGQTWGFNSRTLGRVRHRLIKPPFSVCEFQFTHPGKGATSPNVTNRRHTRCFNSRTLGRVRLLIKEQIEAEQGFNSRTLGRVRRACVRRTRRQLKVSIHAPWEGCD